MNRGRPVSTLVRFAKWQLKNRFQDEMIFNWIHGAKLAVLRGITGATGNIYCGLPEYVDTRFVIDTLKLGDLFVDIGVNVGSYTVPASKVCGVRTIAVEPDPDTARVLRRHIEVNGIGSKVQVVEAAIGANIGTVSFTVGRDTVNRVARSEGTNVRAVVVKTLDDILNGEIPRLIKIDVEGFKRKVFKGAASTLADPRLRAIITKSLDQDVLEILGRCFRQAHYDPDSRLIRHQKTEATHNSLMVR
ncbi:FkbM family methyltransferase [Roseinatronobacter thiooxidans]|uniref:FkbM family methyltransferase n=2 Tax=Roseinatronobacter thiooxidans TaxID=121821 RepID=A0A2W7QC69_9RHOB|nr:FkbM family methyltransferase [Roseinatronobacter thiooxidans]